MSYGVVERPQSEGKIHSRDEFELCYLRHKYFRKANYNPTPAEMAPYMWIVNKFVNSTLYTYGPLLRNVGIGRDDLLSIGQVHLVSYIGAFSLERAPGKMGEFKDLFMSTKYREPDAKELLDKNKADFTCFFKQRMEDLVRVCRQKSKNIKGKILEEYSCFYGVNEPPKNPREVMDNHQSLGFKKLDVSTFKLARKRADVENTATLFKYEGLWFVAFAIEYAPLTFEETLGGGVDPRENIYNRRPDENLIEQSFLTFKADFSGLPSQKKIAILQKFVRENENNKYLKKEVRTAKSTLRKQFGE